MKVHSKYSELCTKNLNLKFISLNILQTKSDKLKKNKNFEQQFEKNLLGQDIHQVSSDVFEKT